MEKLKKWLDDLEINISIILLIWILVVLTMQVVLRFIFRNSNSWSEEMSRYLLIWFSYLSASACICNNTHIRIDTFIKIWPKPLRPVILIVGDLIFLIFCIFTTYHGALYTRSLAAAHQVSLGLGIEMWIVYAAIPVCNAAMALRLVQRFIRMIREPKKNLTEPSA